MYLQRTWEPAVDAERYYASLPETLGTCPFCGRIVQETDDYVWSGDGVHVAHTQHVDDVYRAYEDGIVSDWVSDKDDMEKWWEVFPW